MNELEKSMSEIREIRGILKVIRTALIYTLSFLSSLTIIHGDSVQLNKSNSLVYRLVAFTCSLPSLYTIVTKFYILFIIPINLEII